MNIEVALENWKRWCLDYSDCFPHGYPPEWPMGRVYLPYKVMIDEDEALEEMEREREPDRLWAERVETWVQQLEPSHKIALQTDFIHYPASMMKAWNITRDQLDMMRARRVARHFGTRADVEEYHRLVGSAIAELRDMLRRYMGGV